MNNIVVIIPARSGSKRLPGKNKRELAGKPLILWSLDAAKKIIDVSNIFVSTDDKEIELICKLSGANVPWIRPAYLSTDFATSVDVVLHFLDWYEAAYSKPDGILLLQPTSPFRSSETLLRGISLFNDFQRSIVGVSLCKDHPEWTFSIDDRRLSPNFGWDKVNKRSQDLPPAYVINGAFYLISPDELRNNNSFVIKESLPLVMSEYYERIDIDDENDWMIAEAIIQNEKCFYNSKLFE